MTGEAIDGFSFFNIIIVWFRIVVAGVIAIGIITIGTIISRTIVTGNVVLLVIIDFFDERTGGTTSRGSAFLSREASELQDGGGERLVLVRALRAAARRVSAAVMDSEVFVRAVHERV